MSALLAIAGVIMMLFGFFLAGQFGFAIPLFLGGLMVALVGAIMANRGGREDG